MKNDLTRLTQAQIDAALQHAQPAPAPSAGLSVNAHIVIFGGNAHFGAAEAEKISEAQSRLLKSLVYRVGQAERQRNPAYHDARTWNKTNHLVGCDHHRDIARRDFDTVKDFLDDWLARLREI